MRARWALRAELAARDCFAREPLHGNVLELLRTDRLRLGAHVLFEPDVWLTSDAGVIEIGTGSILNLSVMIAAVDRVSVGAHCLIANGCVITDANHAFDDLTRPLPWQGFTSDGPTEIGDDCWLGAHVVVTSGVRIGSRCVVGANSVVTHDLPDRSIAVGAPARIIGTVGGAGRT